MRFRRLPPLAILPAIAALVLPQALADEKPASRTQEVTFGELKIKVPQSWKQKKPASSFRLGLLEVPHAKGDRKNVDVVVYSFAGGGGTAAQNVPRWLGEFSARGRKATIVAGKSKLGNYVLANISGTHLGPSFRRRPKPLPNARLLVLRLEAARQKKVYYLKAAGEDKTVAGAVDALRAAIGADRKTEKPLQTDKR